MRLADHIVRPHLPQVAGIGALTVDLPARVTSALLAQLKVPAGKSTQCSIAEMLALEAELRRQNVDLSKIKSGGSVANTMDTLARLQLAQAKFLGVGGNDRYGKKYRQDSLRAGVELLVPLRNGERTGHNVCFISQKGLSSLVWTAGANELLTPTLIEERMPALLDVIIIDGYTLGLGQSGVQAACRAAEIAQRQGIPYVLTLASEEIVSEHEATMKKLAQSAWLIAGNQAECSQLFFGARTERAAKVLFAHIRKRSEGPGVLVTRDKKGAWACMHGKEVHTQKRPSIQAVDSCGAGDAFLAGFLSAWHFFACVNTALCFADELARLKVQFLGARFPEDYNFSKFVDQQFYLRPQPPNKKKNSFT